MELEITNTIRKFGPKTENGKCCRACSKPMKSGDYTTLISLGPGDDLEEQKKAYHGLPYTAICIEVHWECAVGKP